MTRTVWKFPFEVHDEVAIDMPVGSEVLKVDAQDGVPTLWALVDPEAPKSGRVFIMRGTGHPVPEGADRHVGSFFHGPFVWHLFEGWMGARR